MPSTYQRGSSIWANKAKAFLRRTLPVQLLFGTLILASCEDYNDSVKVTNRTEAPTTSTIVNYKAARSVVWQRLYADGGQSLYCNTPFRYRQKGFNIEHVMPMSWVKNELGCSTRKACRKRDDFNRIEADLHNLYVTEQRINSDRSSIAFGEIGGERWKYKGCDYENNGRVVEPREGVRGDIARSMLYMSDRYQVPIFARQLSVLLQWHRADPVSDEERARNALINDLQGNSNPFIDNADLANQRF